MSSSGAVLTGGASRRMGRPKAWIPVDGRPMALRVADALAGAGCDPVVMIGEPQSGPSASDPRPDLHGDRGPVLVPDVRAGEGPVVGVLTALRHARSLERVDRVVVAACDLPRLDAATVRRLLAVGDREARVVVAVSDGRPAPLGWWSTAVLADLEALVASGVRAWREAVAGVGATLVEIDDPALSDVDTPPELDRAVHDRAVHDRLGLDLDGPRRGPERR